MKKKLLLFALLAAGAAHAEPFAQGDAAKGETLFAKYDCNSCHREKMGGDGNSIFTRPDRIVRNAGELIPRIEFCSGALGASLSAQEKLDLAAYLNQRYYHFK